MEFDFLSLILPLVAPPLTTVSYAGLVQFDDIFTLILLFACFVAFCLGWVIGLLSLQI
jgi:hypothetical protein